MVRLWPKTFRLKESGLNSSRWYMVVRIVEYAYKSALIGESESKNEYGLLRNHEYTVVEFELVVNRAGEEIQLVRLRNPWGFGYVLNYTHGIWSIIL